MKKGIKHIVLGAMLFFASIVPSLGSPSLRFHTIPDASYFGGIHSIVRDSIGRIWFSGSEAVFMYDGSGFSLKNGLMTCQQPDSYWQFGHLVTDDNGRLYVSSNHGLQLFDYATESFSPVLDGNIGPLTRTAGGVLWLVRDGQVAARYPSGEVRYYPFPEGLDPDPIRLGLFCSEDEVMVGVSRSLYRLDAESGRYVFFAEFPDQIADILVLQDTVYVQTQYAGLHQCTWEGKVLQVFRQPEQNGHSGNAKQLYADGDGLIWVATQNGLMLVNPATGETDLIHTNPLWPYSLPNNSVWSIYRDPDGGVWIGTYGGRLALVTHGDSDADYFRVSPGGLSHPIVSCFAEDPDGNLWIGTEGGGINYWDRRTDRFYYYVKGGPEGLNSNMVKQLRWENGHLGVALYNGGLQRFDPTTRKFTDVPVRGNASRHVYDYLVDGDHGVWMSDPDNDLVYASLPGGSAQTVYLEEEGEQQRRLRVERMLLDKEGFLWLFTRLGICQVDPHARKVLRRIVIPDAPFATNNISCICETADGNVWVGTRGGGINRLAPDYGYENICDRAGGSLSGINIFSIEEAAGRLWIGTSDGLWCYDTSADSLYRSRVNDPSRCGAFYIRSSFKTSRGELVFGGTDGFILFRPEGSVGNPHRPRVYFTALQVNDKPVDPATLLRTSGEPLKLSHRQGNLEIRFSTDSYLDAENNRFAYRMTGLTPQWQEIAPGQLPVQFFDLKPGRYRFEVKAANNDGLWGEDVSTLDFLIKPSPWLTWWALALYALGLLALAGFFWLYFTNKKMYRHELAMERLKEENMRELTQARINFFTNISHDLKTPLTLIADPLRQLKEHLPPDSPANRYANLIDKNVSRIQRMIAQLLTFREIESQKVSLYLQNGDFVRFLESVFSLFEIYADRKGIEMGFYSHAESIPARFDHEVVEKIFTNLFSNAIKYTPEEGSISVRIEGTETVTVTVTNTGVEISPERQKVIFEMFNRSKGERPQFETSTGLGLAIVREMTELVGGSVRVESGEGQVSFIVEMPLQAPEPQQQAASGSYSFAEKEVDDLIKELDDVGEAVPHPRKSTSIVVIDDDEAFRRYLEMQLSQRFNVYTASDGAEGIAKVERVEPQVVITDLMMGATDGFSVCRTLRSSLKSSHIPVIVISGDSDSKVRALESGANVFIEKPFEMGYLLTQIDGLLRLQKELRDFYSKKFVAEPSKVVISSIDERLLSRAMEHIERNMDNYGYDVDEFVSDMAVGRTILYRKIKDITGMSIKEFILDIRLKRAAQLLVESDLTVSEVSDRTGFANPKYFSVCFKRRFDLSPSEYKKQEKPA